MATLGRERWMQADLRCMMCGRVIGSLTGPLPDDNTPGRQPANGALQFSMFRPAEANRSAVRLVGGEQFRCSTCGGGVVMDELEKFSTYANVDDEPDARPSPRAPAQVVAPRRPSTECDRPGGRSTAVCTVT
ncbi:MAG: hypothetical protein M3069_17990 [Chloroflexota bacterium]|nr:hypothetical protein [Chloroflexota bacterium]